MTPTQTFRFKQFAVEQSRDAGMKVGTDGVLLGAWCRVERSQSRFLDIGTGTGLIALMLAQRAPWARIDALDIDAACCTQAGRNITASPWSDRVSVINSAVQDHAAAPYDHIVSNPPYFTSSLFPLMPGRTYARHTVTLTHNNLLRYVSAMLAFGGLFSLILPAEPAAQIQMQASNYGLSLRRVAEVFTRKTGAAKRVMMEFERISIESVSVTPPIPRITARALPIVRERITLHDPSGEFTGQYRALTGDFYLKF